MALDEQGNPTCGCGDPLCDAGAADDSAYWEWARNPDRRPEEMPAAPASCASGASIGITSRALVDGYDHWCDKHDWSSTGLATILLEAFMFGDVPPSRKQLEDEHRLGG